MNLKRYTSTVAVLAAVFLLISAAPASAATVATVSTNETASELGAGSLTNAEVERSGSAGLVGHDLARSSAVARWAFDNGSGSTAYDHVGSNDGTITGATWTSGVSGQALDFDGASDQVAIPDGTNYFTNSYTVAGWIDADTTSGNNAIISLTENEYVLVRVDGGNLRAYHDSPTDGFLTLDAGSISGGWNHFAVTWDGSRVRLFLNGELVDSAPATDLATSVGSGNNLGSRGGNEYFDGKLDDLRAYDEALTPGQVRRLADAPSEKQSAPATERWAGDGFVETVYGDEGHDGTIQGAGDATAVWLLNEGDGSTAYDLAESYDGTLNGNPQWVSGYTGEALDFDGSGDYVDVGDPLPDATTFTVSAWVKVDNPSDSDRPAEMEIITSDDGSSPRWMLVARDQDGDNTDIRFTFYTGDNDGDQNHPATSEAFNVGQWYHVVGVKDGDNTSVYVDGTLEASATSPVGDADSGQGIRIGAADSNDGFFPGIIDNARVYSTALSSSEVGELYAHPEGRLDGGTYNGEDYGNELVDGKVGGAVSLEGASEYVEVGAEDPFDPGAGSFAVTGWFNLESDDNTRNFILTYGSGGTQESRYQVEVVNDGSDRIEFEIDDDSTGIADIQSTTTFDGSEGWTHFAAVRNESSEEIELYVNGNLEASQDVSGHGSLSNTYDLVIGNTRANGLIQDSEAFNGDLDDIRYYDRSLSPSEVQHLYDNPSAQLLESSSYVGTHDATNTVGGEAEVELQNATATLTWEGSSDGGSSWTELATSTVSTSQTVSASWSEYGGDDVRLTVDYEATAPDHYARLQDESVEAQTKDPAAADASLAPNTTSSTVSSTPIELSADISDVDFGTQQGDQVTAKWYVDGNLEDTTTHSSNGTISTTVGTVAAGSHTWHLELTDSYGNGPISSSTADFVLPSELTVYNESNATQVVDDGSVSLELRFYGATNTSRVYEVPVNNGVADMTGLPANEEFVVVAKASGYYDRRIYVSSLVEQQRVYLLPDDQQNFTAVFNVFTLVDRSGTYPAGETRLIIQRALNTSGNGLEWTTIAGDFFGATNEFPVYLRYEQRYRIIVENDAGDRREIGAYTAADENNPKPITIKSIIVDPPEGQEYYGTAWVEDETDNDGEETFRFTYSDPTGETEELTLRVHERGNESKEIINKTITNVGTEYAFSYTLKNSSGEYGKAWQVTWSADRGDGHDGDSAPGGSFPVGQTGTLFIPFDPEWLARFGLVALPVAAALASERIATLGAIGTVVLAGLLMVTGLWEIPVVLWIAALVIALGGHALTMAKRGSVFG